MATTNVSNENIAELSKLIIDAIKGISDEQSKKTPLIENDKLETKIKEKAAQQYSQDSSKSMEEYEIEIRKATDFQRKLNNLQTTLLKSKEDEIQELKDSIARKRLLGESEATIIAEQHKLEQAQKDYRDSMTVAIAGANFNLSASDKMKDFSNRSKQYQADMKKAASKRNAALAVVEHDSSLSKDDKAKATAQIMQTFANDKSAAQAAAGNASKFLGADIGEGFGGELSNILNTALSDFGGDLLSEALGSAGPIAAIASIVAKIANGVNKMASAGITEAVTLASEYLGTIDARLQGNKENITYATIAEFTEKFNGSQYVSMKSLTQNVSALVEQGIVYNVEERALLETIKDKMVSTFDVLDASLTRLIRLQDHDYTYSMLGAESALTQMLNGMFADSSYLNSLYDTVNSIILDGASQFTNYADSVGYTFNVQKWLGSLYSVGMSESAIQAIAQGLNYLSTGNVTALNSNTALQNLLALSASQGGLNYASLLTEGLSASSVDSLMSGMIAYLTNYASNSSNNVVKSAWGDILGFSLSDIKAASNLSNYITTIANNDQDYSSAVSYANSQLAEINNRTTIADRIDNAYNNLILDIGNTLVGTNTEGSSSTGQIVNYLLWTLGDKIGGTIGEVMQAGVIGGSLISDTWTGIKNAFSSWFGDGSTDEYTGIIGSIIDAVNAAKLDIETSGGGFTELVSSLITASFGTSSRGSDYIPTMLGTESTGTSFSGVIGNVNASEIGAAELAAAANKGSQVTTTSGTIQVRSLSELYAELFEYQNYPIRVKIAEFEDKSIDNLGKVEPLKYLADQASGTGINVDLGSEDASALANKVYTVRTTW